MTFTNKIHLADISARFSSVFFDEETSSLTIQFSLYPVLHDNPKAKALFAALTRHTRGAIIGCGPVKQVKILALPVSFRFLANSTHHK